MSDYNSFCTDCGRITNSVSDHATGDLICSDCGLVLDSRFIDDSREWRTFSNSGSTSDDHDPNRVGEANNTFLTSHLTTFTSNPKSTTSSNGLKPDSLLHVGPTAYRIMNREGGQMNKALGTISNMCDQLGLISSINHLAQYLYSTYHLHVPSSFRGRHHDAFLGGCIYVACTQEGLPRTVKEISSVSNGASKKDILRVKAFLTKHVLRDSDLQRDEDNNTVGATHEKVVRAGDLVKRFCSNAGMMNHRVMKAAQETVDKLEGESNVRRSPVSVAIARHLVSEASNELFNFSCS